MMEEILDPQRYREVQQLVSAAVVPGSSLPEPVLRSAYSNRFFLPFDACYNPSMISLCSKLCVLSESAAYYFSMIHPSPVEYYFKHFKRFGVLRLEAHSDSRDAWEYFKRDPGESRADALVYIVNRFVIVPDSLKWVLWGSREHNVIILGTQLPLRSDDLLLERCSVYDLETALAGFLGRDESFNAIMRLHY